VISLVFWLAAALVLALIVYEMGIGAEHSTQCPTCGLGELSRIFRGNVRGGPYLLQCDECRRVFRERFDGRLIEADPADPAT
jgi:hypothetical protein